MASFVPMTTVVRTTVVTKPRETAGTEVEGSKLHGDFIYYVMGRCCREGYRICSVIV